ncbi:MAG: hypothetical protein IJK42_03955 [Prevotella sp.]|nr:hypothetical protein [Prevotella sp.]MBQ6208912.1 hypothetical protein [Prevotella sp.]
MRKTICIFLASMAFASMDAQTNPQAGYIITLGNDTVYGTVDYRTDAKNARSCLFRADGEQTFREYMLQDIRGYRLQGQGVFYVTRSFPVEGETKTFFAEYLLKGGVSLYRHRENETDYYYFVDENGNVYTLKETGVEYMMGTHRLSLTGNYVMRNFGSFGFRAPMFTVNIGFVM